jgi:hypothetical protein
MASNGKIPNMKVVDLRKLRNFVVDKFLIWIYLVPQKSDLHSVLYSMTRTKTAYGCIWVCGVVVEEASREVEVTRVQTTASAESRLLREKMHDLRLDDEWVAGPWGPSYTKSFFCCSFSVFKC